MGRNTERDAREAARRKNQLMDSGFRLFSERGIENVSLQEIADDAEVGIATLYKYYTNKVNLVVAISTRLWGDFWKNYEDLPQLKTCSSYEGFAFYCDQIIRIYQERPDMLRFSSDYKTYIHRQNASRETTDAHLDALKPIWDLFASKYQCVDTTSVRQDIPARELYTTVAITMLSMAERYTQGLVWADDPASDHLRELQNVKDMLLLWVKPQN